MTAAELEEIKDQLAEIQGRYGDRDDGPVTRPPGAREVRLFAVTSAAPRLPGPPGAGTGAGAG